MIEYTCVSWKLPCELRADGCVLAKALQILSYVLLQSKITRDFQFHPEYSYLIIMHIFPYFLLNDWGHAVLLESVQNGLFALLPQTHLACTHIFQSTTISNLCLVEGHAKCAITHKLIKYAEASFVICQACKYASNAIKSYRFPLFPGWFHCFVQNGIRAGGLGEEFLTE